uniref:Chloride channel protein n=1 Tax=Anisakis simplex TaxID=6269 RepID=A0A0M3J1C5_ANISI
LKRQSEPELSAQLTLVDRVMQLKQRIDLDDIAIDPAPFQLVMGTSLYKVHTLFSLLSLNHAYVTHRGRLVGVIAIKELREALADIYTRGAVPTHSSRRSTLSLSPPYAEQASPTITVDKMTSPISGIHVPVLSSMPISATSQTIQTSQTLAAETTDSAASGSRRMSADSCASDSTGPYRNTIQLSSRNSNANETLDDNEEENLLT